MKTARKDSTHTPRVVIDTNCLIQMLGRHSSYRPAWEAFREQRYTLCISNEILSEYEEILSAKASPLTAELFTRLILQARNVLRTDPHYSFGLIEQDPDDNKFVDCAITSGADYIVSEDAHFHCLASIPFPKVNVIPLDKFLAEVTTEKPAPQ